MKAPEQLETLFNWWVIDVCGKSSQTEQLCCLTGKVEESITGFDVGKEGVPQALALGGALDQSGDVSHIEEGWHLTACVVVGN